MSLDTDQMTLSGDELRVIGLAAGVAVPSMLSSDWDVSDLATADVVARRGLLARGLAVAIGEVVALAPGARRYLGALFAPETVIELEVGGVGQVLVSGCAETLAFTESHPELWTLERSVVSPVDIALELTGDLDPSEGGLLRAARRWGDTAMAADGLHWAQAADGLFCLSEGIQMTSVMVDHDELVASLRHLLHVVDGPLQPMASPLGGAR